MKSALIQVRAWMMTKVEAIKSVAKHVWAAGAMVARWVWMGAQSLLQAARMALAWVIAMGPVGWVIAAVVALAALIIANWDKIVAWTKQGGAIDPRWAPTVKRRDLIRQAAQIAAPAPYTAEATDGPRPENRTRTALRSPVPTAIHLL